MSTVRPCALVVTIHETGWMAGCHCGAAYRMPIGLYDDAATTMAMRLHERHLAIMGS